MSIENINDLIQKIKSLPSEEDIFLYFEVFDEEEWKSFKAFAKAKNLHSHLSCKDQIAFYEALNIDYKAGLDYGEKNGFHVKYKINNHKLRNVIFFSSLADLICHLHSNSEEMRKIFSIVKWDLPFLATAEQVNNMLRIKSK